VTGKTVKAEEDGYVVTFENNGDGTGMDYSRYNQTVYKSHPSLVLPTVPDIDGYDILGWTTTKGKSTADDGYEMGRSVRISADTTFYLVCKKLASQATYSVTFNNNNGTSTSTAYTKMNMTVTYGTVITLPTVSNASGYETLGWTTAKGKTTPLYKMGSQVKVVGNVNFYLVRRKITYCTVTFNNNNGTSTSAAYTRLNKTVQQGTTITLPTIANTSVYETVGWTTAKGKTTPIYKCGSTYKISSNTKFYLVRKKIVYYTVQFYSQTGATSSAYKALTQKVAAGGTVTLPSNLSKTNYAGAGWALAKNASSAKYAAGKTIRVTKNLVFYAVYKPGVQVKYYSNDGTHLYKTVTVAKGGSLTLSGIENPSGYTMLGWSTSKGKNKSPTYLVGDKLTVNKSITLYAVLFSHSQEVNFSESDLPSVSQKYSKVIFVGDSRTNQVRQTLQAQFDSSAYEGVSFVCQGGSGLSWLKTTGYTKLMQEVGEGGTAQRPIAIVFNHGINDLGNISSYITYMKTLAAELQQLNCKLFYMSVNPCNNAILIDRGDTTSRPEATVRSFNASIRSSLCSSGLFTYIDTYSIFMKNGYSMNSGAGVDDGYDDGLHYSTATSKRIYVYCMRVINAS
jgi:hypothetical protein